MPSAPLAFEQLIRFSALESSGRVAGFTLNASLQTRGGRGDSRGPVAATVAREAAILGPTDEKCRLSLSAHSSVRSVTGNPPSRPPLFPEDTRNFLISFQVWQLYMTLAFSIRYTLHHAVPTRFKVFDIVAQGGADLKDCSEFNIFLNSYGLFYDEEILKKKHGKEIKMSTYCLPVKITSTLKRLSFFKVTVGELMGVLPHPQMGVLPRTGGWSLFAFPWNYKVFKLNNKCFL